MMQLNVRLESTERSQRDAVAWLISGDNPIRWIEEITSWQLDEQTLTLFVIPKSRHDSSPGGILVAVANAAAAPARMPAGLAFGLATENVYVPVDARLLPALSEPEIRALSHDEVVIFHPALGPIGFELDAAFGLWDLLTHSGEYGASWRTPPMEITPHPRIESVTFRTAPSLAAFFGAEANDIATQGPESLPPVEGEPSAGMFQRGLDKLREALGKPGKELPGAKAFQGAQQWISANLRPSERALALARSRNLMRLLDLLKSNPDEGLKRALPLGSSGLHRGLAPPSAGLGERPADFSIQRLGGGRAVDSWQVPPELMQQLRSMYFDLAERERHLGRYRRAAYIYAELLGDLLVAARVLEEGGHWHEAALLYRDHLHNPPEAARCFVQARMIPDAVEIYEKIPDFMALGDLYRMLGEDEKADNAFRTQVARLLERGRRIAAADVLEKKLHSRDEALALLEDVGWREAERRQCWERVFAMRGSAGEHEASAKYLQRLAARRDPRDAMQLVEALGALQKTYPDRMVRELAEDIGRRQVAEFLLPFQGGESFKRALHLLPLLAPGDRLLARDAGRYLDRQKAKTAPAPPPFARTKPDVLIPVGIHAAQIAFKIDFSLPSHGTQWMKASPAAQGFCVAGYGRRGAELVRATFTGETQSLRWHGSELPDQSIPHFLLCTMRGDDERIFLAVANSAPLSEHVMPETDFLPPASAGTPAWLGEPVTAATPGVNETLWVMRATFAGAAITGFRRGGNVAGILPAPPILLATRADDPAPRMPAVHLAAAGEEILCAVGNTLHRCGAQGAPIEPVIQFEEEIRELHTAPQFGSPHVAVVLESRIAICWLGVHRGRVHVIDAELRDPIAGFTSEGTLVALDRDSGLLMDSDSRGRLRSARFTWRGAAPIAVLRGPSARTFVVIDVNGLVRIFSFPQETLR